MTVSVARTVELRLLGPLEVRLGDGPIDLGPRKQRAVLAMLALKPGRTVAADHLAEGLWGDESPPSGAKMVQLYVSHLRRLLGDNGVRIVTHGRGYELQLTNGEVDVVLAERLLDEQRPRDALALWRGQPLADLAEEPFAAAEIRRLEELRLRATEMAVDADLEAGRHAEVISELDALAAEHPLRERVHGQRMLALYRCGRQSEALEAYRDARASLVDEIGVEPGADLRRLQEGILAQDPALDLPTTPDAEPAATSRPPPPRARHLLIGAAVLLIAGITAFGVIRVLEPEGLGGHRRELRRADRPGRPTDHGPVRGRREPERRGERRRIGVGRERGRRHRLALLPEPQERLGENPGRRQPRGARLWRRFAVGGGQR